MAFQVFNGMIIKGLCCFMFLFLLGLCDASKLTMTNEKHKVKKISSRTNIISLKSIKSPYGDIIDCVDISHQPAFDHPLLKNHTILMRPSYYPKGLFHKSKMFTFKSPSKNDTQATTQLWQWNEKCPEGTIPIIRTKQEDLIKKKLKSHHRIASPDLFFHEYAVLSTYNSSYYGTKATINVWNPQLQERYGFSLSQFWISGGSGRNTNSIEGGWIVSPTIFGDTNTRFFIYWTRDNYRRTGCYNLRCPGFVQISSNFALGDVIQPWSIYHSYQHEFTILVWKDPSQGVWWLQYDNEVIGYWPLSLFTVLSSSPATIQWGGEVASRNSSGPHTRTQMGSGHFPEEGYTGASYFRNLHVVDGSNTLRSPDHPGARVDNPNCYNLMYGINDDWDDYFFYGGPGRNPHCP